MSADNDPLDGVTLLSEAAAASVIGWGAANLRSHRLRHEAWLLAQGFTDEQRQAVTQMAKRGGAAAWPRCLANTKGVVRLLAEPREHQHGGEPFQVELTQWGIEVARRIRNGKRGSEPPRWIKSATGQPRYRRADLLAWLAQNPNVKRQAKIEAATISTDEAAKWLGLEPSTLKSFRSKATKAQAKIDRGEGTDLDQITAARSPPFVLAGSVKRYRLVDLEAWATAKGRRSAGPDPLVRPVIDAVRPILSEAEMCALAGFKPSCLPGYRSRARGALRWLAENQARKGAIDRKLWAAHEAKAKSAPPHVVIDGVRCYYRQDVDRWLAARKRHRD